MDGAIFRKFIVPGNSPGTLTGEKKSPGQAGIYSKLRTHPSWRCEEGTEETSWSLSCWFDVLHWSVSANQNRLTTSELLVLQSQKVFPGMEEVVVFLPLEEMSCLAEPVLDSDINSFVVSHVKNTPETISVESFSSWRKGTADLGCKYSLHVYDGEEGMAFKCYQLINLEEVLAICPRRWQARPLLSWLEAVSLPELRACKTTALYPLCSPVLVIPGCKRSQILLFGNHPSACARVHGRVLWCLVVPCSVWTPMALTHCKLFPACCQPVFETSYPPSFAQNPWINAHSFLLGLALTNLGFTLLICRVWVMWVLAMLLSTSSPVHWSCDVEFNLGSYIPSLGLACFCFRGEGGLMPDSLFSSRQLCCCRVPLLLSSLGTGTAAPSRFLLSAAAGGLPEPM